MNRIPDTSSRAARHVQVKCFFHHFIFFLKGTKPGAQARSPAEHLLPQGQCKSSSLPPITIHIPTVGVAEDTPKAHPYSLLPPNRISYSPSLWATSLLYIFRLTQIVASAHMYCSRCPWACKQLDPWQPLGSRSTCARISRRPLLASAAVAWAHDPPRQWHCKPLLSYRTPPAATGLAFLHSHANNSSVAIKFLRRDSH